MPIRNVWIIILSAIVSLTCYEKSERNRYAATFAEAMNIITRNSLDEVKPRDLFEGAMNGMVSKLDRHSAYINPDELRQFQESLDQEFFGIGIVVEVDPETKRLTVTSPMVGTPAYKAGVRAGDVILEIDGHDTEGMQLSDSVKLIKGKRGDVVTLLVRHVDNKEPVSIKIARDAITTESVMGDLRRTDSTWNFFLADHPRIGYIRLTSFGEHSAQEIRGALGSFSKHPIDGLILDLRNDPGGLLKSAVEICDMFIDKGVIVSTRGRGGIVMSEYLAHSEVLLSGDVPMVVLTNRYSASASEIVSACLQDQRRAIVVGERTWGKGTVQNIIMLEGGTSALKLTTASYWRPSEKNIHRRENAGDDEDWGVRPDSGFEVKLTDEEFETVFKARHKRDLTNIGGPDNNPATTGGEEPSKETSEPFVDPQLQKAVEYLDAKIAGTDASPQKA